MQLARSKTELKWSNISKHLILSVVATSILVLSGCASRPQLKNTVRYEVAPDFYTVRTGDTLSKIAARYGLNYIQIAEINDIAPPYRIFVNQSLRLKSSPNRQIVRSTPRPLTTPTDSQIQRQTIQMPSSPITPAPAVVPAQTVQKPSTAQVVPALVTNTSSKLKWVKPSNGVVIESFNNAQNIKGTRYGGNLGDPIFAAADGQVVYAADGLKEYGNLVLIKHIDGYITAYAHNSRMLVKSGQNVSAGQQIAEMGSSGAKRIMLEFQVRLDGKPINPANILLNN